MYSAPEWLSCVLFDIDLYLYQSISLHQYTKHFTVTTTYLFLSKLSSGPCLQGHPNWKYQANGHRTMLRNHLLKWPYLASKNVKSHQKSAQRAWYPDSFKPLVCLHSILSHPKHTLSQTQGVGLSTKSLALTVVDPMLDKLVEVSLKGLKSIGEWWRILTLIQLLWQNTLFKRTTTYINWKDASINPGSASCPILLLNHWVMIHNNLPDTLNQKDYDLNLISLY